jgi:hypothetical protein
MSDIQRFRSLLRQDHEVFVRAVEALRQQIGHARADALLSTAGHAIYWGRMLGEAEERAGLPPAARFGGAA